MKIAIIGSRGFLVSYGGFETFVNKLVLGLKDKGYEFTVYGLKKYRNPEKDKYFPEVKRIWLPSINVKFLEKVSTSFLSVIHASFSKNKVLLLLGVSPVLLCWLPRLLGKKIIINVDGIEWKRPKWSKIASFFLRLSEALASVFCHIIIADSKAVKKYFKRKYKKEPVYIPYGADINNNSSGKDLEVLKKYGLKPREYFLQVCRIEPENNPHITVREFIKYKGEKKLVIIGDTPHSIEYKNKLKRMANHKIKFLGAVYGEDYKVILRNAYCYIHGHEAGGTNPALLEAMAAGKCPIVLKVPYNLEVIENCGFSFTKKEKDLLSKIEHLEKNGKFLEDIEKKVIERVKKVYSWEKVISKYEKIFKLFTKN